jgi:UDP-2,4-diacetamido-2,4,6-trideoxy-beta-L-altropyranose hydrolase
MNQKQSLLIRADATRTMGTGHIMRCIALAQEWTQQGGTVHFLSHCASKALEQRITGTGAVLHRLETFSSNGGPVGHALELLQQTGSRILIMDGYHFEPEYHTRIRREGFKLLIIDDYQHLGYYDADIILNQNLGAEKISYQTGSESVLLLGSQYTLLRDEFLNQTDDALPDHRKTKILISMGGADPDNTSLKALNAVKQLAAGDLSVRIILGPSFPHEDAIKSEIQKMDFACELIINTSHMRRHMAWADMAVAAAGSTAWELLFMGVPTIFIVNADNQKHVATLVEESGAGINAGWHEQVTPSALAVHMDLLLTDKPLQHRMGKTGTTLIDGKGRQRVVNALRSVLGLR